MNPGWEQENSPMYPLITFKLKVSMMEISVSLRISRRYALISDQ